MFLNRQIRTVLIVTLLLVLAGQSTMFATPARAQDDEATLIYRLARSLYYDDLLHGNITFWVDGNLGQDPTVRAARMINRALPNFRLAALNGNTFTSRADLTGPYLMNFWASWCPPCRDEFPRLVAGLRDGTIDIPVVFVNAADRKTDAVNYVKTLRYDVGSLIDSSQGTFSTAMSVDVFPTTFLVDEQGKIQAIHVGELDTIGLRFMLEIARNPGVGTFDADAPNQTP